MSTTTLQLDLPPLAMKVVVFAMTGATEPRVGVMFTILLVSFLAVSFPTLSRRIRIPGILFFIGKHFGTGVILATAFIHLLDDAFRSLQSKAVEERYGKMGHRTGLIILASLLSIFLVEYISTSYVEHLHDKPSAPPTPLDSLPSSRPTSPKPSVSITRPRSHSRNIPRSHSPQKLAVPCTETTPLLLATKPASDLPALDLIRRAIQPCHDHHIDHGSAPVIAAAAVAGLPIEVLTNSPRICRLTVSHDHGQRHAGHHHSHENNIHPEAGEVLHYQKHHPRIGRRRQVLSILVLQLGIMIHSLVIGLTLSVASGSEFASLTTAIIFHQLFEGLSLGIRIAALPPNHRHNTKPETRGRLESRNTNIEDSSSLNENNATSTSQDNKVVPSTSVPPTLDRRQERSPTIVSCHALANLPHPSSSIQPLSPSDTVECGSLNHKHSSPNSIPTPPRKNWVISKLVHVFDVRRWRVSWGDWKEVHWLKPTLSLLFAVTTPFGIGLGMAVWGDRDKGVSDRAQMLVIQGIMSAISAGMLIYAATVEMIAGDFVFGDVEGHHHHHHHGHEDVEIQTSCSRASSVARREEERIDVEDHHSGAYGEDALGERKDPKATIAKKILAVVSLLAGSSMMVLVGLGE